MFLQMLASEEKEAFLELAYIAANVDGELHQAEQQLLSLYRGELGLHAYEVKDAPMEDLLSFFSTQREEVKKMVFFEVLGVIWVDGKVRPEEADLLSVIQEEFNIEDSLKYEIIQWMDTELQPWFDMSKRLNESGARLLGL